MTNTFVRKVQAERKVLRVVNSLGDGPAQLACLSSAAIEAWRRKSACPNASLIGARLVRIADLCHRLSDRSHEHFNPIDPMLMAESDRELLELRGECGSGDL
jgi:hypothetical protein